MQQKTRKLKVELLELLAEKKRRQEIQAALQAGAILVHNRDGSVTGIRVEFVEKGSIVGGFRCLGLSIA